MSVVHGLAFRKPQASFVADRATKMIDVLASYTASMTSDRTRGGMTTGARRDVSRDCRKSGRTTFPCTRSPFSADTRARCLARETFTAKIAAAPAPPRNRPPTEDSVRRVDRVWMPTRPGFTPRPWYRSIAGRTWSATFFCTVTASTLFDCV